MLPRRGTSCCGMPENLLELKNVRRCETFVERELANWLDRSGDEIDPYETEQIVIDMDELRGSLVIGDGTIKGLRSLHRSGDCYRANNREDRMRFNVNLGAGPLRFESECGVQIFNFTPPTFKLYVDIDYLDVFVDFCYNFSFGLESVLHKVELKEAKGMKIRISGLGFYDRIFNPIIRLLTWWRNKSILGFIEREVQDEINDGFYTYQFPYAFIAPLLIW
ncbi:hypothetical protein JTE90_021606 [Oedothorax gibbosus]|uniref:Uncharacterized protein n=1 Tax=Oedothorax gibbosus TaxID=931172 RepID=A0AAV6VQ67_9ARAC|nr:hypothetical protein JTE90_021606 [Oedothorax gibbosus]